MEVQATTKLTYDDYVLIPDDGLRHEIIDGEHFVNAAPNVRHQRILRRLLNTLDQFIEEHDLGEVFCSPIDVVLSKHNVVQPDVLFIRKSSGRAEGAFVKVTPDLVVEILSISNRKHDEVRKLKLYDDFYVGEYWIIDPEEEIVKVFRRADGGLRLVESVDIDGAVTSPLFPDFSLPARRLFD